MKHLKTLSIAILVLILILCATICTTTITVNAVNLTTSAKSMCVIEANSGRIVAQKDMNIKLPMASTTKIVTALTVIQNCSDLNELIQVSDTSIGVEGSSIYLKKGEIISVKDLLYGLMLRSGNDSAVALACHVGKDMKNFAKMMNETARVAGAENSNFVTPHGLDDKEHYTTAHDLAIITAYSLKNPIFKEIVSTKKHIVQATNMSDKRYFTNKNRLLNSLEGCVGIKTGYTKRAGRCLVSATERDNQTFVCVVLNCGPMFEESASLLNSAHGLYKNTKIIDSHKEIYNEYFLDKKQGKLYLYAEEDFTYPLKEGEENNLKLEYSVKLDNAKDGDVVGEIKVFYEKDLLKTIKLVTMNKIDKLIEGETLEICEVLWVKKFNS